MPLHKCLIALFLVPAAMATMAGWLDRVVLFQKQKLFKELKELAPIKISAELQAKPAGYVDSTQWDFDSVQRLLTLMSASETAKSAHQALRRMLQPNRRLMMSMKESKHRFPSIRPQNNEFYYDAYGSSAEHKLPAPPPVPEDEVVLVVTNPVEARLPSARISVKLLRDILDARARAARQMPTTKNKPWLDFIKNLTRFSTTAKRSTDKTTTTIKTTTGANEATTEAKEATTGAKETTTEAVETTTKAVETTKKADDANADDNEANSEANEIITEADDPE